VKVALSRTTRRVVGVAIVLLIGAYLLFSQSDEAKARRRLTEIVELVSQPGETELRRGLAESCSPDLSVEIPEFLRESGRDRVGEALVARLKGKSPVIALDNVELRRASSDRFEASFDARVSDSQAGDLHADIRRVNAVLVKTSSGWQLASLRASGHAPVEPEARP
jgi:hypothetical protein